MGTPSTDDARRGPVPDPVNPATPPELELELNESLLDGIIGEELGGTMAEVMRQSRRTQEAFWRREHPDEGLRERKRRVTRQLISDAATMMFAARGFDEVTVSEVARRVGVSEKTIYNYFPTKESLVLDATDEMIDEMTAALRDRAPGKSITDAVVDTLERELAPLDADSDAVAEMVPAFVAMIEQTPSLHAAWLEVHTQLARAAAEALAAELGVDPTDPEPMIAGRSLVGLVDVGMHARVRHTEAGLRGQALSEATGRDLRRAARLLETGLSAFTRGAQTGGRIGSG